MFAPCVTDLHSKGIFFPIVKYFISQSIFSILFHLSFFTSFSGICSHKKPLPISNLILDALFSFTVKLVPAYAYTVGIALNFLRTVVHHEG